MEHRLAAYVANCVAAGRGHAIWGASTDEGMIHGMPLMNTLLGLRRNNATTIIEQRSVSNVASTESPKTSSCSSASTPQAASNMATRALICCLSLMGKTTATRTNNSDTDQRLAARSRRCRGIRCRKLPLVSTSISFVLPVRIPLHILRRSLLLASAFSCFRPEFVF